MQIFCTSFHFSQSGVVSSMQSTVAGIVFSIFSNFSEFPSPPYRNLTGRALSVKIGGFKIEVNVGVFSENLGQW